jgi:hypothetical protein
MAPPTNLELRDRTLFWRGSTLLEILAAWALVKGTTTTPARSTTLSTLRAVLVRLFILRFRSLPQVYF